MAQEEVKRPNPPLRNLLLLLASVANDDIFELQPGIGEWGPKNEKLNICKTTRTSLHSDSEITCDMLVESTAQGTFGI